MTKVLGTLFGIVFVTLWTVLWVGATGFFDVRMVNGFIKQHAADHYSSVTGRITHSQLDTSRDDDGGTNYNVNIQYQYVVNGRTYTSNNLMYGTKSETHPWACSIVTSHPEGAPTTVYYNPDDPSDAVLLQGIDGTMLIGVVFLIPFNVIAFGTLYTIGSSLLFGRWRKWQPSGGVPIRNEGSVVRASLYKLTPLAAAAIALFATSFALTFVLMLTNGAYPSPLWPSVLALLAIAGSGYGAWRFVTDRINSGRTDLVIDRLRQTIHLPLTCGRKEPVAVKLNELAAIEIEYRTHMDSDGDRTDYYAPTLAWCESTGAVRSAKLIEWTDKARAEAFVKWLREEIGKQFA